METSDFDFENLLSIFEKSITNNIEIKNYNEFLIAYSGGVDSTALLYFANKIAKKKNMAIRAIHINHNLNKESKNWEYHCKNFCKKNNINFEAKSINISISSGDSIEERARDERYFQIYSSMNEGSIMMTAHHLEDQAETFLYQLLRGSGSKGLSSMPIIKKLTKGIHLRPFLSLKKSTLIDIVEFSELSYVNDNSNSNISYSRNFIRKKVIPLIENRWPSYAYTISRSANNAAESMKLNNDLASIDIKKYLHEDMNKLGIGAKELSDYRFNNVVRFWIQKNKFRMPTSDQLKSIYLNVFNAGEDKAPFFLCSEYEIRRSNNYIEIMKPLEKHDPEKIYKWKYKTNLVIPHLQIDITWKHLEEKLGYQLRKDVEVKFRRKGENVKLSHDKSLKDYMRENKIPIWKRERTPLIYVDKELKIILD